MTNVEGSVTGGVDTHGQTHHAAVIDQVGRQFADAQFPTTSAGYRALLTWLRSHGQVDGVGVEGTGAYGAALCRYLREQGVVIVEVDRPDRKTRRTKGKSDPIDAYAAARAALSGQASGTPKTRDGKVEATRALRPVRSSAVKARTQAINQLKSLLVTGPADLREQLRPLDPAALVEACARLRPGPTSPTRRSRSRPRCAGWPPASRRSTPRSPRPTVNSPRSSPRPRPAWSR